MKYLIFFSLLVPSYAIAQMQFMLTSGYATHRMSDMKIHQKEIQENLPVEVKVIEKFPSYVYHDLTVRTAMGPNTWFGFSFAYNSTGGRMHYEDYSGEISCNQMIKAYVIAPELSWLLNQGSKSYQFQLGIKAGTTLSKYDLNLFSRVGSDQQTEYFEFTSLNFGLEPGVTFSRQIFGPVALHVYAGYNLNLLRGKVAFDDHDGSFLQTGNGDNVTIEWTGIRTGLGIMLMME